MNLTTSKIHELMQTYPKIFAFPDGEEQSAAKIIAPDILKLIDWEYEQTDEGMLLTSRILSQNRPAAKILFPKNYKEDQVSYVVGEETYSTYNMCWHNIYTAIAKLPDLELPEGLDGGFPFIEIMHLAQKKGCLQNYAGDFLFYDRQTFLEQNDASRYNAIVLLRESGTWTFAKDVRGKKDINSDAIRTMAESSLLILPIRNGKPGKFVDMRNSDIEARITTIRTVFEKLPESRSKNNLVPVAGNNSQMLCVAECTDDKGKLLHHQFCDAAGIVPGQHQQAYVAQSHKLAGISITKPSNRHSFGGPL